ncbi:MAG: LptF/LptG family permease [Gemmatimonadota bacterium]
MRLISRYLLGQLVAPFTFALAALTGILILDQVAKKFGALVGKGLDWHVIAEVFVLSLPFIVAMTLPMAVLVGVLYTFSHLAADQEITAMRAGGVSVRQMLGPVLAAGVVLAAGNFIFVDQVLPRSNARLRNLWLDISKKKPTFQLREQVINELPPSRYYLRASRIDANSGRMRNVTIYDMGSQVNRRIVYADSGRMAFTPNQRDISLLLWNGSVQEYRASDPLQLQLTYFITNDIRVRDVANQLERSEAGMVRGDREMSTCEIMEVARTAERDLAQARATHDYLLRRDLALLLGLEAPKQPAPVEERPVGSYCGLIARVRELVLPAKAAAQAPRPRAPSVADTVPPQRPDSAARDTAAIRSAPAAAARQDSAARDTVPVDSTARDSAAVADSAAAAAAIVTPPTPSGPMLSSWAEVQGSLEVAKEGRRQWSSYMVEIHKKWSISVACAVFVLVGIALALRFPRGGIGLVIGGSLTIFCLYYVALTAGESLADRGLMHPAVAMWSPIVLLTVVGVWGLILANRWGGSTRGGDLAELFDILLSRFRFRRDASAPADADDAGARARTGAPVSA